MCLLNTLDVRLSSGDELRLRVVVGIDDEWLGVGQVIKIPESLFAAFNALHDVCRYW